MVDRIWIFLAYASYQQYLSLYEKYDGGMIYLGNDSPLIIVGCGRVLIKFPNVILRGSMDFYILLVSHETYYQ
jgi:hypothetical protein